MWGNLNRPVLVDMSSLWADLRKLMWMSHTIVVRLKHKVCRFFFCIFSTKKAIKVILDYRNTMMYRSPKENPFFTHCYSLLVFRPYLIWCNIGHPPFKWGLKIKSRNKSFIQFIRFPTKNLIPKDPFYFWLIECNFHMKSMVRKVYNLNFKVDKCALW